MKILSRLLSALEPARLVSALIPAALLLAALAASPPADPTLQKARTLYGRAHDLTASFEQESVWQGVNESMKSRGTLSLALPDRVRLQYTEPEGDLLVSDGKLLWTYVHALHQAVRTELDSTGYHVGRLLLVFLDSNADIERVGEERAGKQAATVYRVRWENNPFRLTDLRLWIARSDGRIVRFEFQDEQGNRSRYDFSKIRFDRGLAESLFQFEPPPGTDVVTYSGGGPGHAAE